jgi:hypothetical protein
MNKLLIALAAWMLLIAAGPAPESPSGSARLQPSKYLLRLKPTKGQKMVWAIQSTGMMSMDMEQFGASMKAETAQGTFFTLGVGEQDGQSGEISMSYIMDSVAIRIQSTPGGEMSYNSNRGQGQNQAIVFSGSIEPVLNKPMTAAVSSLGVIREIAGLKEALGANSQLMGDGANVNNPFDLLQNFQPVFPEKKVRVGDSWKADFKETSSGLAIQYEYTYTLSEVRGDLAILAVQSLINMPSVTVDSEQGPMEMSLKGVQRGEIHVQLADGMTRYGKLDQEMEMLMGVMGIVIPTEISGSSTLYTKTR